MKKRAFTEEQLQKMREAGRKGGKLSKTGGFHHMKKVDPERLKQLQSKGGRGGNEK